jgi:hypothetical protein
MAAQAGAPHTAEGLPAFTAALRGQRADALAAGALDRMATTQMPPGEREEILTQMLLTEREAASLLMFSNATQDWRDLPPGISVPALVIGGGASIFPAASIQNQPQAAFTAVSPAPRQAPW